MSVLTEASLALSFVVENFGMAMAARMPIITTTISNSISVKPLRFSITPSGRTLCRSWPVESAGGAWRRTHLPEKQRSYQVPCQTLKSMNNNTIWRSVASIHLARSPIGPPGFARAFTGTVPTNDRGRPRRTAPSQALRPNRVLRAGNDAVGGATAAYGHLAALGAGGNGRILNFNRVGPCGARARLECVARA